MIVRQLEAYYQNGDKQPSWNEAVKGITSAETEQRSDAAEYLVALLDRAQKDELSGKAPWRASPFWGSSGENPARNLRNRIAIALAEAPVSSASLAVVRWYLDHETVPASQEKVLHALAKIDGKEADAYRLSLVQPPHENNAVARAALMQIGLRKISVPEETIKTLCHHYRASLREAARKLNRDRAGPEPSAFDAGTAVQTPPVANILSGVGAYILEEAPPDAHFVVVRRKAIPSKPDPEGKNFGWHDTQDSGWLLEDYGDSCVILSPFGRRMTFRKEERSPEMECVFECTWKQVPIASEVERVAALRKAGDRDYQLSDRGALTGQFEGHVASVYEMMLAHWLFNAKKSDLAAQVFLPALETVPQDRKLVEIARQRFGDIAGHSMLQAFAYDRDFKKALLLAQRIVERYPGTRFHGYAVRLSEEIPKREGDFKEFKLPTPGKWAALKLNMSRTERIEFLGQRMRLLNCFQLGQPGGFSLSETQYAQPRRGRDNQENTVVINPYVELAGASGGFWEDNQTPSKGMELTIADIPHLAQFLRDDWHILCVSYWRDFHPSRTLENSRPIFVELINQLAGNDFCSAKKLESMTPEERESEIQRITKWARAKSARPWWIIVGVPVSILALVLLVRTWRRVTRAQARGRAP